MPAYDKTMIASWAVFFLSPFLWPNILESYIAMDLLAFASALAAAALMAYHHEEYKQSQHITWIFLALLLLPIFIQLIWLDIRNPWKAMQMAMYIISAWLIFRMAQSSASELLGKYSWFILLAIIGNAYALFSVIGAFVLHPNVVFDLFPIWTEQAVRFGGVFMQANMQSLFLCLVCISLWSRAICDHRYWPWLLASLLPCAGLIATSSRGSAIVLFFGIVLLLYLSQKRKAASIKLFVVIVLAFTLSEYWRDLLPLTADLNNGLLQRFESSGTEARLFIWDMTWRLFLEHPWFGIGAGNLISYGTEAQIPTLTAHPGWSHVASYFIGGHSWAHNLLLQFFCEWGVIGGLSLSGLILAVIYRAFQTLFIIKAKLTSGIAQAAIGSTLMLMHGMVSISMMQGFFFVLFALYTSALFSPQKHIPATQIRHPLKLTALLLPAILMFYQWQLFITKESAFERSINLPVKSEPFIIAASDAISSPWSARPALQLYFASMLAEHVNPSIIIGSENFAYRFWFLHQSTLSLRYLILIAHLKDDVLAEQRLINTYRQAYPQAFTQSSLSEHTTLNHQRGESLDISR